MTQHLIAAARAERAAFMARQPTDGAAQLALVRAAVLECADEAWGAMYAMYRPQLITWVIRQLHGGEGEEDINALADGAFMRFWRALTPERLDGFRTFAPVYQYLRLCARSEIVDALRSRLPHGALPLTLAVSVDMDTALDAAAFWRCIRSLVDDDEWRVIRAKYYVGMQHRHIAQRWPCEYPTSKDVDRVERRVLSRLRHRADIRAFKTQEY